MAFGNFENSEIRKSSFPLLHEQKSWLVKNEFGEVRNFHLRGILAANKVFSLKCDSQEATYTSSGNVARVRKNNCLELRMQTYSCESSGVGTF